MIVCFFQSVHNGVTPDIELPLGVDLPKRVRHVERPATVSYTHLTLPTNREV